MRERKMEKRDIPAVAVRRAREKKKIVFGAAGCCLKQIGRG